MARERIRRYDNRSAERGEERRERGESRGGVCIAASGRGRQGRFGGGVGLLFSRDTSADLSAFHQHGSMQRQGPGQAGRRREEEDSGEIIPSSSLRDGTYTHRRRRTIPEMLEEVDRMDNLDEVGGELGQHPMNDALHRLIDGGDDTEGGEDDEVDADGEVDVDVDADVDLDEDKCTTGGHPVELFEAYEEANVQDKLCPVCLDVVRDAVEGPCGHVFCQLCAFQVLQMPDKRCPLDQRPLQVETVRPNHYLRRAVLNMPVRCPNHALGCASKLTVRALADHRLVCPWQTVLCGRCELHTCLRNKMAQHKLDECVERSVTCAFCAKKVRHNMLEGHVKKCPECPVPCPNACEQGQFPRGAVDAHVRSECPRQQVSCPVLLGCCPGALLRCDVPDHCKDVDASPHLAALVEVVQGMQRRMDTMQAELVRLRAHPSPQLNARTGQIDYALWQQGA